MSNPALNDNIFDRETRAGRGAGWGAPTGGPGVAPPVDGADRRWQPPTDPTGAGSDTMTINGTVSASAILLGVLLVAGWFGWQSVTVDSFVGRNGETVVVDSQFPGWLWVALIGGLVLAVVTVIKPQIARITGPLYAAAQGLFVGAISKLYEVQYDGIVGQAVGLTVGVFAMMLVLYATGTVRVTDRFRKGIIAATGAVALVYLVSIGLRLFGAEVPFIHESGAVGILFSLVVVGIASANLLLDFDLIEKGSRMGAPRYMEWYGAFGLMVTLIWLYLELLRLLAKLRSR